MHEKGRRRKHLGEILVDRGVVTEEQVAETLRPGKGRTCYSKLGEGLVYLSCTTADQIQAALKAQGKF